MSSFTDFEPETSVQLNQFATRELGMEYRVVTKPFTYHIGDLPSDEIVKIPQGYITDGASIPVFLKRFIPSWGKYGAAAIVHDLLCETLTIISKGQEKLIDRKRADRIFLEAMKVLKVPFLQRWSFYIAVRAWVIYNNANHKTYLSEKKKCVQQLLADYYAVNGNYNIEVK